MVTRFQAWLLGSIETALFGKRKGEKMLTQWMQMGRTALVGMMVAGCHHHFVPVAEPDEVTDTVNVDEAIAHDDVGDNGQDVPNHCPKLENLRIEPWFGGFYPRDGGYRLVNVALVQVVANADDPELVQSLDDCYELVWIKWTTYDLDGNTVGYAEFTAEDYLAAGQPLSTKTLHRLGVPSTSFDMEVQILWNGPEGVALMNRRFWVDR